MTTTIAAAMIGSGRLTWNAMERRTDRYGAVYLIPDEEGSDSMCAAPLPSTVDEAEARKFEGRKGRLFAKVTETRDSTHIGDLFRGIFPRTPKSGAEISFGSGLLFVEAAPEGGVCIGLRPEDDRDADWLDPRALYDAHEQSVDLFFEPEQ